MGLGQLIKKNTASSDELESMGRQKASEMKGIPDKKDDEKESKAIAENQKAANKLNSRKATDAEIDDIINGKYGNGDERKTKLTELGIDAEDAQSRVNTKVRSTQPQETTQKNMTNPSASTIEQGLTEVGLDGPLAQVGSQLDESKIAQDAVDTNDPLMLQDITDPEGQSVLKGSYDMNGHYVPYVYTDKDVGGMTKGTAGVLTVISIALAALGGAMGIPVVPVNFYKLFGKPEAVEAYNKVEQDYANVVNGEVSPAVTEKNTRDVNREANINDINAYKDVNQDDIENTARVNAASAGSNTTRDINRDNTGSQLAVIDAQTKQQLQTLKQQGANAQELAQLMYNQNISQLKDQIQVLREAGFSNDDIAKYQRAMQGTTTFGAGMNYVNDAGNMLGGVAGSILNSSKDVKMFNTRMLSNAWSKRK